MEPKGGFLAEWNGTPAGTVTTTVHGPDLAWIGMVLVHPDFRRRGIDRALLERCIESLQNRNIRCIKLDATSLGKIVYDVAPASKLAVSQVSKPAERGRGRGLLQALIGLSPLVPILGGAVYGSTAR